MREVISQSVPYYAIAMGQIIIHRIKHSLCRSSSTVITVITCDICVFVPHYKKVALCLCLQQTERNQRALSHIALLADECCTIHTPSIN